jgi:hypothetical protein
MPNSAGAAATSVALLIALGNDDSIGEWDFRENLWSDDGSISQLYFVYYKK